MTDTCSGPSAPAVGAAPLARVWRRCPRTLLALAATAIVLPLLHQAVLLGTDLRPPDVSVPPGQPVVRDGVERLGASYARARGGVREVFLSGDPEAIGSAQARLNHDHMVDNEGVLWREFARVVPFWPARAALMDLSRVRYRRIDRGIPEARRRELAAEAAAFAPDPYASRMSAYHRMVFLHSLYDIALSFEHSPLVGCSTFGLGPGATRDGHVILARAFDFEAGDVFDRDKAVYFVRGDGTIAFASVAWPGLVGVVSGMNAEGVVVVVHGARARTPLAEGEPAVFMLREVLERAHDGDEAIAILMSQRVMVSHVVIVADARGHFAAVERAPGVAPFVRDRWADPDRVGVTNHFEGPLADDPRNLAVRARTTTLARRARLDELLAQVGPHEADAARAVAMLRDHRCAGGVACDPGDRRAIDALIATHGIVADATDRVLWVSAGPHLSGPFVRFDLKVELAPLHDPSADPAPEVIAADPILYDGRYEAGRARAGRPRLGGDAPEAGR